MRDTRQRSFKDDRRGSVALIFALALPVLVPMLGAAVDYSRMTGQVAKLQKAADAAAIATARELSVANASDNARFKSVARSVANANFGLPDTDQTLTVEPTATANKAGFTVKVAQTFTPTGLSAMLMSERTLSATATAQRKGAGKMCVLVLSLKDPKEKEVIKLEGGAQIIGQDCGTFSNSTSPEGISMKAATSLLGSLVCSAGGIKREPGAQIASDNLTDCPKVDNPLADRLAPAPGSCFGGKTSVLVLDRSQDLYAGTYCGGIEIKGSGTVVTLRPSGSNDVLIIKDGLLKVTGDATLYGRGVGIAFNGSSANFEFTGDSTVDLHAPATGPLAGILFYGSLDAPDFREYKITSDNARVLVGTIYIPKGFFTIDAKNPVADLSAYTAIIVSKLNLKDAPKLTLNTNYYQTMVPVSKGLSNFGGSVNLTQ